MNPFAIANLEGVVYRPQFLIDAGENMFVEELRRERAIQITLSPSTHIQLVIPMSQLLDGIDVISDYFEFMLTHEF